MSRSKKIASLSEDGRGGERQARADDTVASAPDLARAQDFLSLQYAVVEALTGAGGWREALTGFLRAVCENLRWNSGDYWRLDPETEVLRCAVFHPAGLPAGGAFERQSLEIAFPPGRGLPGRVWVTRTPALIPDLALDADFHRAPAAREDDLHAAFAFPVLFGDEILGVIEFFSHEPRQPEPDLLEAFAVTGRQLGQYVHRRRTEDRLVRSERELHDFFHNGPLAMNWTAEDGTILRANRAELELLGYSESEYLGRNVAEFHVEPKTASEILERLRAGDTVRNFEAVLRRRDGLPRHVLISSNALWEDGALVHSRTFTRDITIRKRLQAEITSRAREVARANRNKDEFLALLGHELRNPLTPIRNALEILRIPGVDEGSRETSLQLLERQFRTLSRLVDDLLDVSRFSLGTIRIRRESLDLHDAVHAAVSALSPMFQSRRQSLQLHLSAGPLRMHGDAVRIEQVITNLLTNASQHGRRGGTVEIETERKGENAVLRVRDDGDGIAPENLPHVFDLFRHGPERGRGSGRGLGIGLTLVQQLVELHGGSVHAESQGIGLGSEFLVRLPLGAGEPGRAPARRPPLEMGEPPGLRVLVVDDDEDVATSLSHLLSIWGFETSISNDGKSALRRAKSWKPDVVLLDLELPQLDGIEVAQRLHGSYRNSEEAPRIVVMTGYGNASEPIAPETAPVFRTLIKPIEPDQLRQILHHLANEKRRLEEKSGSRA